MNHGLKINGNILEITLPENIHIDKVMVNRQIFSQRMQVCKSCKYHGLEGHEEPCVSCEVGNSNYVPSAEPERKKGKWIYSPPNGFKCSECGGYLEIGFGTVKMNFCPNCGADMRGEQDE